MKIGERVTGCRCAGGQQGYYQNNTYARLGVIVKFTTIVSGKVSDMYEAGAGILQAPAFCCRNKNENGALRSSETVCFTQFSDRFHREYYLLLE